MPTTNLAQLKQALAIAEQIYSLEGELASVLGGGSPVSSTIGAAATPVVKLGKRTMSAATKAKMRASQQARWAKKINAVSPLDALNVPAEKPVKTGKRTMSLSARARIAAAQKARWAAKKGAAALNSPVKSPSAKPATRAKAKSGVKGQPRYAR